MGSATLTPNGDVSNTSWTYSTGTTANTLLNDSSDSTYMQTATAGANFTVNMSTTTIPSGAIVKSVTPKIRAASTSGAPGYFYHAIISGAETSFGQSTVTASITTYTAAAQTIWPPTGTVWSQTLLDGLQLKIYPDGTLSGTIRVYELSAVVLYAEAPTVTVGTVTNGSTSTPTIPWTYVAGTDGGPQVRYEVKVFDSGTYGGGSFSPDTSTATWSTLDYSSVGQVTVTAGYLAASTTYKAYVRVAQLAPDGTYQTSTGGVGSGWAVSSSWTNTADKPAPPTLTVTPDSSLFRVALDIQGHDNLMTEQDANLETAASVGNWVALTNCSVAQSTTQAISPGTGSLRMSSTASGDMEARTATGTSGYPVVAARVYTLRASFRAGATTRSAKVGVRWYDSGGTIIGSASYSGTVSATNAAFVEASADVTAPAGALYAAVSAYVVSTAAGSELFYVDEIALQEKAGNTPAAWYRGGLIGSAKTGVQYFAVQYSDDSGTTWSNVRGGSALTAGSNQLVATLYDKALQPSTTRQYRAKAYYTQGGSTVDGAWVNGSATANLALSTWILTDTTTNVALQIYPNSDRPFVRPMASGMFAPLGTKYPIEVADGRKARQFTLIVETAADADLTALLALTDNANTFLLQGPASQGGYSMYIRIGATTERRLSALGTITNRQFELVCTEVAEPA